jgi:hypothetical protein
MLRRLHESTDSRHRWRKASSLGDLGDLTARWLTGDIRSQPGYRGTVDVDEDLAPGLTDALVAANRSGFLTWTSQAGQPGDRPGWGQQLAWVDGVAPPEMARQLAERARNAGYEAHLWQRGDRRRIVTWDGGRPFTAAGWTPHRELRGAVYRGVGDDALREICSGQQISIIDPAPGRNTLWQWLAEATSPIPAPEEDEVSIDVSIPNTATEDVPAHIEAGGKLATAIEDFVEQYGTLLADATRTHVTSAEGIQGYPGSLLGAWEEDVAARLEMAMGSLGAAAEGARACAAAESAALMPSVDAADAAPADSNLAHADLRSR